MSKTTKKTAEQTIESILGYCGRVVSGSKSFYHNKFPDNLVIFNANLCTAKGKKWHGDLDLTADEPKLKAIAKELNETIFVLYEMDGRFENEKKPKLEKFAYSVAPDGTATLGSVKDYYHWKNKKLTRRSENEGSN